MIKALSTAILFCLIASTASAEVLRCTQTKVSSNGFKSIKAAQSWFPKKFAVAIKGKEAISDFYGKGTVTEESGRTFVTFTTAAANGARVDVRITYIQKSKRYTAVLGTPGNYAQTPGARGKCSVS